MNLQEMPRFQEPTDIFYTEDWQGAEIYEGEEYLEIQNRKCDKVLLEKDNVMEYLSNHFEFTLELLDNMSIRKVAIK